MVWTCDTEFKQLSVTLNQKTRINFIPVQILEILPARHPKELIASEKVGATEESQISDALANPVAEGL